MKVKGKRCEVGRCEVRRLEGSRFDGLSPKPGGSAEADHHSSSCFFVSGTGSSTRPVPPPVGQSAQPPRHFGQRHQPRPLQRTQRTSRYSSGPVMPDPSHVPHIGSPSPPQCSHATRPDCPCRHRRCDTLPRPVVTTRRRQRSRRALEDANLKGPAGRARLPDNLRVGTPVGVGPTTWPRGAGRVMSVQPELPRLSSSVPIAAHGGPRGVSVPAPEMPAAILKLSSQSLQVRVPSNTDRLCRL